MYVWNFKSGIVSGAAFIMDRMWEYYIIQEIYKGQEVMKYDTFSTACNNYYRLPNSAMIDRSIFMNTYPKYNFDISRVRRYYPDI